MKAWCVYILRCGDTRGRGPLEPVYLEQCGDMSAALKREHAIKRLSRKEKLALLEKAP